MYDLDLKGSEWRSPPEAPPANAKGGQKDDSGKIPTHLLPRKALLEVAKVLAWGAYHTPRPDGKKGYGENNWQKVETARYVAALDRHLAAVMSGERYDSGPNGSGLPHAAHLACCALFILAQTEGLDRETAELPEWFVK